MNAVSGKYEKFLRRVSALLLICIGIIPVIWYSLNMRGEYMGSEMIGPRLKELRRSMKLPQWKMTEILGVSQSSINRYERNTARPTVENFWSMRITSMFLWTISLADVMSLKANFMNIAPVSSRHYQDHFIFSVG